MQSIVARLSKCSKFQFVPPPLLNSFWRKSESCQSIVDNTLSNVVTVGAIEGVASVLSFSLSKERRILLLLQPWARSLRPGDLFPVEMNLFQALCCSVT